MNKYLILIGALLLTGCVTPPLTGGATKINNPLQSVELHQSENPAATTKQDTETRQVKTYTLPKGTIISNSTEIITLQTNMVVVEEITTKSKTELGAAQKDFAREIGAKLGSLKPVMFFGIVLAGLGIFGLTPWGRPFIASTSTSIILLVAGAGVMILPTIIVGNELLIILGAVGLSLGYFFVRRYGEKDGKLKALEGGK